MAHYASGWLSLSLLMLMLMLLLLLLLSRSEAAEVISLACLLND